MFSMMKKLVFGSKRLPKGIVSLALALMMTFSMFTMTGCSAEELEGALDIAIDVLDALETEEYDDAQAGNSSQKPGNTQTESDDWLSPDKWDDPTIDEDGWYNTKDEVALYIYTYGELPDNYLTKNEARDRGWDSKKGNLWDVADGMSIGGDRYYNNDDQLPEEKGRKYYECDINYEGGFRGGERIVFSNDGLIYYTGDHYESFELLYGEE